MLLSLDNIDTFNCRQVYSNGTVTGTTAITLLTGLLAILALTGWISIESYLLKPSFANYH